MMRVNVVLPEPDAPITARHSPARTSADTSNNTCRRRFGANNPATPARMSRVTKDASMFRADSNGMSEAGMGAATKADSLWSIMAIPLSRHGPHQA